MSFVKVCFGSLSISSSTNSTNSVSFIFSIYGTVIMPISLTSNKPLVSFEEKRKLIFQFFSQIAMSSDINVAPESIN